jgi:putative cell wall-binding protein
MKYRFLLFTILILFTSTCPVQAQDSPDAILSSDNPADQALASLLSKHLGIPLVESRWGEVNNDSILELISLNLSSIYVIGGEAAIPNAENSLLEKGISIKKRFNGSDRYETAALVALEWGNSSTVVVAYGYDEEGMTTAISRAELEGAPLILVPKEHLPSQAKNTISILSPKKVILTPSPDMIQNFLLFDFKDLSEKIEFVVQDHEIKTHNLIKISNSTLIESNALNFTFTTDENTQEVVNRLLKESRAHLETAEEAFRKKMFNLAFTQAVLSKFKAKNSIRIKNGIIKIVQPEEPRPKESKPEEKKEEILKISQVLLNPMGYSEKNLQIKGKVESVIEVGGKAYVQLFDGTGRILITFLADRDLMISKGFIFMADPDIAGITVTVNGTLHINVPVGGTGGEHGTFAYLIEAESIRPDID